MGDVGGTMSVRRKLKDAADNDEDSEEETLDSENEDETIARIRRAHYAQAAAMNPRRRSVARARPMSHKRKMEAVKNFHDFTKKLKKDTGIRIHGLVGNNILELSDFSSEDNKTDSDGLSEEEFVVNPSAVQELTDENESYIDPETGDIRDGKRKSPLKQESPPSRRLSEPLVEDHPVPKVLTISDIINEGDLDLSKNVEISEVEGSELCPDKTAEELLDMKQEDSSQDFDITEKLKEMEGISVKPLSKMEEEIGDDAPNEDKELESEQEKKPLNTNALNVRRNIREVMDEKNLDASTLTAQRQESERLARVQEQQRIIREVQRQIAINRQNKIHQKTISLLQGGSSLLKKSAAGHKLNLPNTVLVKLPSGELKKTTMKQGQLEVTKLSKPMASGSSLLQRPLKQDHKSERKEVVEIVDSSSGEETSSSSSDSDDCIMLSDSEVPPSPEADEDPHNSGLHVNDAYNIPDEQGRVLINIGHAENEEDIFLAPQIGRIIKPHQIGGVRFLFDNIIESVNRFSTSTGFGCILAHSMGLGKTLQIVCFCDIFLRHTNSKTVLCIMPINTLQNWVAEFNMWLPVDATNSPLCAHGEVRPRNFPIYVLNDSHKTLQMRAKVVKDWSSTGGVLMIGYELYRLLSMKKDKKPRKKKKADAKAEAEREKEDKKSDGGNENSLGTDFSQQKTLDDRRLDNNDTDLRDEKKEMAVNDEDKKLLDEMYEALVRPGPDLVICDEGHRIKNSHSNISYALKQMRTKRRVVLTGYPLQNNLLEYWCMVDFVRPNYLGSKTEFCNMFERPIQNGQCIDSTPQDIRLMRYRAHVLHSLLVGFVQRRSHAVLQSTLPQKEEYVLLVRLTPMQRQLYNRFMNEVVRSATVPNPLKAFAICCKIWNHPDVLYNFLKKRDEVYAAVEEDLDLEEIGGVTKAGRPKISKAQAKKAMKSRVTSKKPAATIQPNTAVPGPPRPNTNFASTPYNGPPNPAFGPMAPDTYRPDQPEGSQYNQYPPYQNTAPGYFPPNPDFNPDYGNNYYPQQPPQQQFPNNYPSQYPPNNPDPTYNQNYWGNSNYYENSEYYNNPQFGSNPPPHEFGSNPPADYNNGQQYPPNYNAPNNNQPYSSNPMPPYPNNQEGYGNPSGTPFRGSFPNVPEYSEYAATNNTPPGPNYPPNQTQEYTNGSYPPAPYTGSNNAYDANPTTPYNQYANQPANYPNYPNSVPHHPQENANSSIVKTDSTIDPNYQSGAVKSEPDISQNSGAYANSYNYQQPNPAYPETSNNTNDAYNCQYPTFPPHLEIKQPRSSSDSPIPPWPLTHLKTEIDKLKAEEKFEVKSESDGEVKIEDLDTKTIVKDEVKRDLKHLLPMPYNHQQEANNSIKEPANVQEPVKEKPKRGRRKSKTSENKKSPKPRGRTKAKTRKDRKASKDKTNDMSDSEESEKEEKLNKEEELALAKKTEEMTYDWASDLLKDYIPGMIENSAKMELFFYILNESIKLGDRLLLFSQSLFTLNLIEDFLEKNYIPGTNQLWERNKSYYRLDGSTHALEREKLINEFNANPHVYLFLVSTRAGSLGINLVGANRVIVFDASWNPCHDTQAVCRVYRYGQKKPCFVYRFVMDCCLEKKIYDRQINKQGMADRVVDECNPDAVLSMKEITNLCFDNDEKDLDPKDLTEHRDKYIDMLMQGIITLHSKLLSKEPFQHESLLVDRKEKKLSSAEKRLAQRGYELEKKAASAPKPATTYRTVRTADGSIVQRPVASVRPMQHGARWIPADVWRRQGMTAQEMTLPLDVVIPTNSAEKTNIVLKAGQRVMVLKSPKGIYMQLESGKIIAIKTSFKGLGGPKAIDGKENPIGKKVLGHRPSSANIPGSLKNNSAITITSKTNPRTGYTRVLNRSSPMGQRISRPMLPGQKIAEIRNRLGEMRAYSMRPKLPASHASHVARMLRPNLTGSLSITRVPKEPRKSDEETNSSTATNKNNVNTDDETEVLDSDDESHTGRERVSQMTMLKPRNDKQPEDILGYDSKNSTDSERSKTESDLSNDIVKPVVLTTDEKLQSEEALETKELESANKLEPLNILTTSQPTKLRDDVPINLVSRGESKLNLLKNYRHQRASSRLQSESSLIQLEKTAIALNKEGIPDFRKNLDDITQSYSPTGEEKTSSSSRKKKTPKKLETADIQNHKKPNANMSHSVSSMLNSSVQKPRLSDSMLNNPSPQARLPILGLPPRDIPGIPGIPGMPLEKTSLDYSMGSSNRSLPNVGHGIIPGGPTLGNSDNGPSPPLNSPQISTTMSPPNQTYPTTPSDGSYGQYPGYGMTYPYPNPAYYGGYGGAYYPASAPYGPPGPTPPPAPYTPSTPAPTPDRFLPEQHW